MKAIKRILQNEGVTISDGYVTYYYKKKNAYIVKSKKFKPVLKIRICGNTEVCVQQVAESLGIAKILKLPKIF